MKVRYEKAFCEKYSRSLYSADKMDNNKNRFLTILYSDTVFSILIGGRYATTNFYKFVITSQEEMTKRNVSIMQGLDCIVLSSVQICPVGQVRSLAEGEMSGS